MNKPGDTFNVRSHNQAGGITAGQVFIGGGQRTLDSGTRQQLLQNLPKSDTVNVAAALGDAEAFNFAAEIKAFLESQGYTVTGVDQCVWMPPVKGANVVTGESPKKIQIGSK